MDIIQKILGCIDYQSIYALEDDFNKVGLTVQTTSSNRVILCKLIDGKIKADKVIEDYIFIGSLDKSCEEISNRAAEKIVMFVSANKGSPSKLMDTPRAWRDGLRMYELTIPIANEDVQVIEDEMMLLTEDDDDDEECDLLFG